jgi:hypothetical protein
VDANTEFELAIHRRLLAGDNVAPAELVVAYLGRLVNTLRANFRQYDETIFVDAATDALFSYIQNPTSYDPSKLKLFSYLAMAAKRDLLNAVQKKVTRKKHEIVVSAVEHERDRRNMQMEAVDPNAPDEARSVDILHGRQLAHKLRGEISDPRDWKLIELMLDGVRDTGSYSELLGATNLSKEEQRKLVKQHKDRLGKQLERFGAGLNAKRSR